MPRWGNLPTGPEAALDSVALNQALRDLRLTRINSREAALNGYWLGRRTIADTTVYVDGAAGSDAAGDGSAGSPYATIQFAIDTLPPIIDHIVVIDIAGTAVSPQSYAEAPRLLGFSGGGRIFLRPGDSVTLTGRTEDVARMGPNYWMSCFVDSCACVVHVGNTNPFIINPSDNMGGVIYAAVEASRCPDVRVSIAIDGNNVLNASSVRGVSGYASNLLTAFNCTLDNTTWVFYMAGGGNMEVFTNSGSGNGTLFATSGYATITQQTGVDNLMPSAANLFYTSDTDVLALAYDRYLVEQLRYTRSAVDLGQEGWQTIVTGGGSTRSRPGLKRVDTGAGAGDTARLHTGELVALQAGQAWRRFTWDTRIVLSFLFTLVDATTNGQAWVTFGKATGAAIGNPADKAVGIRLDNLALAGLAHTGGALNTAALGNIAAQTVYRMTIISDGAGNVSFHLDGVQAGTAAGPTGLNAVGVNALFIEATNGGDAAPMQLDVTPNIQLAIGQ